MLTIFLNRRFSRTSRSPWSRPLLTARILDVSACLSATLRWCSLRCWSSHFFLTCSGSCSGIVFFYELKSCLLFSSGSFRSSQPESGLLPECLYPFFRLKRGLQPFQCAGWFQEPGFLLLVPEPPLLLLLL